MSDPRMALLLEVLPEAATVVELGCGNGTRETRALAARAHLTGVDHLLRDARFELVRDEPVTIAEPEGVVTFHWVLARG